MGVSQPGGGGVSALVFPVTTDTMQGDKVPRRITGVLRQSSGDSMVTPAISPDRCISL